jgi:hypothetical protein
MLDAFASLFGVKLKPRQKRIQCGVSVRARQIFSVTHLLAKFQQSNCGGRPNRPVQMIRRICIPTPDCVQRGVNITQYPVQQPFAMRLPDQVKQLFEIIMLGISRTNDRAVNLIRSYIITQRKWAKGRLQVMHANRFMQYPVYSAL